MQTAAFNLPNDERIGKEMGTKRTMLKNVQEAKFDQVLVPIAEVALAAADRKNVSFEAFFTHILMHELMHGLGPHEAITVGRQDDRPCARPCRRPTAPSRRPRPTSRGCSRCST